MSKCPNGYGGHALDTTTIRAMRVCVCMYVCMYLVLHVNANLRCEVGRREGTLSKN